MNPDGSGLIGRVRAWFGAQLYEAAWRYVCQAPYAERVNPRDFEKIDLTWQVAVARDELCPSCRDNLALEEVA